MKRLVLAVTTAVGLLAFAGPAAAHVSVKPNSVEKGSNAEFAFEVPNEKPGAKTIKVEVQLPTDHPLPQVTGKAVPNWEVETTKTQITWSGGSISGDESVAFPVAAGPMPSDASSLVFKVVQTYDNGEVVRWIDDPTAGDGHEGSPAPELLLTEPASGPGTSAATGTQPDEHTADTDAFDDDEDSTPWLVGAYAAIPLVIIAAYLVYRKKRSNRIEEESLDQ